MNIIIVGLNHKTAPVDIREQLDFTKSLDNALSSLKGKPQIKESMILSTCNRVEIYALVNSTTSANMVEEIKDFFSLHHKIEKNLYDKYLYAHIGNEALKHMIRVPASLDSMVIGETQIFGQVKEAYTKALEKGNSSRIFNNVFQRIFAIVKKIRTETEIGRLSVSVSSAAVDLAEKIFGHLKDKTIIIVGAGKMSELTAKHLIEYGVKTVFVTNRSYERAIELAKVFSAEAVKFDELQKHLLQSDIVIVSTGAPHYIVTKEQIHDAIVKRHYKPLFIIDISVPRNVDPEVNKIENVYIFNIDDLQSIVDKNKKEREKSIIKAEEIVEIGANKLVSLLNHLKHNS